MAIAVFNMTMRGCGVFVCVEGGWREEEKL